MPTYRNPDGTMNALGTNLTQRIRYVLRDIINEEIEDGASVEEVVGMTCGAVTDVACETSIKKRLGPPTRGG